MLEWLVGIGDSVQRGDVVAVVDTEKSEIEVEIWQAGTIAEFLVEIGEEVPVGTPLARLSVAGDRAGAPQVAPAAPPPPPPPPSAPARPPAGHRDHPGRVVSPLVRHLAEEQGVDLEHLVGSGPADAITRADVERAPAARGGARPPRLVAASPKARRLAAERGVEIVDVAGSGPGGAVLAADLGLRGPSPTPSRAAPSPRAVIAALMARSNREIPHFHLSLQIDLGPTVAWVTERNVDRPVTERILPVAVLLQATARAVARHPAANGFWVDDSFQAGEGVHLGVAVALRGGGLVAPAIPDADQLDTDQTMAALRDLVGRARGGRMRSREMSSATITVTNLGDRGVDSVYGVIHPPQVALIGFGQIADRALVVDGELMVRPALTATLAGDHRALDGHDGARVLATIARLLGDPAKLNPTSPEPE